MLVLTSLLFVIVLDSGQFQETGERNNSWIESYNPTSTMNTQSLPASEFNQLRSNAVMPTIVFSDYSVVEPLQLQASVSIGSIFDGGATNKNTSNSDSISPEPSVTDLSAGRTQVQAQPTETLSSAATNSPLSSQTVTFASPLHISNSLESDLPSDDSQLELDVVSSTAESFSSEEAAPSHHFPRYTFDHFLII